MYRYRKQQQKQSKSKQVIKVDCSTATRREEGEGGGEGEEQAKRRLNWIRWSENEKSITPLELAPNGKKETAKRMTIDAK